MNFGFARSSRIEVQIATSTWRRVSRRAAIFGKIAMRRSAECDGITLASWGCCGQHRASAKACGLDAMRRRADQPEKYARTAEVIRALPPFLVSILHERDLRSFHVRRPVAPFGSVALHRYRSTPRTRNRIGLKKIIFCSFGSLPSAFLKKGGSRLRLRPVLTRLVFIPNRLRFSIGS